LLELGTNWVWWAGGLGYMMEPRRENLQVGYIPA